ncbi:hypothetical protein ILYODFUR_004474 [Ilyodon furcidens]|uniref:Uncharacterized protein n=1 Tax=Ilyodon furcidens TaxID=33524 RepID=A0ABV0U4F9_9TELE
MCARCRKYSKGAVQSLNNLNDQIASFMVTRPKSLEQEQQAYSPPETETLQKSMNLMRHLLVDAQGHGGAQRGGSSLTELRGRPCRGSKCVMGLVGSICLSLLLWPQILPIFFTHA